MHLVFLFPKVYIEHTAVMLHCRYIFQTINVGEMSLTVSDLMTEFSSMQEFDLFHFFIFQKSLHNIYSSISNDIKKDFFSLLFKKQYAGIYKLVYDKNCRYKSVLTENEKKKKT